MRFVFASPLIARSFVGLALSATLAACGEKAADNGASRASNKVLEGSTSDAMIAFDQLRSQGQQAEPTNAATEGTAGTRARAPATAGGTTTADAPDQREPDAPATADPAAATSDDEG